MKSKKNQIIALTCATMTGLTAAASMEGVGLGAIIGEPTGITLKKWVNETQAFDAAAGWSFSDYDSFHFHADYLFHNFEVFDLSGNPNAGRLPLYAGIGGRIKLRDHHDHPHHDHDHDRLGIRVPLGIAYLMHENPIEFFAELVPVLDVAPDTDFDLNIAAGVRFYIK